MNIYTAILTTIEIGAVLSILAICIDRLLVYLGLARGDIRGLIIVTLLLTAIKQIIAPNLSVYFFGLFIILVGPISINRYDIIKTFQKGRWWWNKEDVKKYPDS